MSLTPETSVSVTAAMRRAAATAAISSEPAPAASSVAAIASACNTVLALLRQPEAWSNGSLSREMG